MRRIGLSLLICVIVAPPLVAQAPRTITITAYDTMKWDTPKIVAKPGEPLRIQLVSKGVIPKVAMAHNFVLLKAGTVVKRFIDAGVSERLTDFIAPSMRAQVIAASRFAGPGETVWINFKAPEKRGSYTYLCTFAGHVQAGMKGTLVVR